MALRMNVFLLWRTMTFVRLLQILHVTWHAREPQIADPKTQVLEKFTRLSNDLTFGRLENTPNHLLTLRSRYLPWSCL
jgi:hypothetical protein